MQACDIWKIQRHKGGDLPELPEEWFSLWLFDSIIPGTGPTVADAYDAAVLDLTARNIGSA